MARVSRFVPSRSAGLLSECQKIAAERFPGFLKMVFDKADDHLFDIANKADNSRRQTIFFDAMRELRLKRTALESGFMDNLKKEFQSSLDLSNDTHKTSTKTLSLELSLVAHDDVEETLAVTNFIESIRTRCKEELFALDQRMQHLLSDPDFEPNHNPFGPHTIGNAFRTTCQQLESGIEVKLTMFKLFDKLANTGINSLYRDLNQHLIRQDVLPKLMPSVHRHGDRGGKTRVIIETEDSQTEATGPDVFSTLQQLMLTQPNPSGFIAGGQRPVGGNMGANPSHFQPGFVGGNARLTGPGGSMNAGAAHYATPDGGPAASGGGGSSQAAVTTSHFVNSLTQLQHGNSAAFDGAMQPFSGEIFQAGNANVLHTLRSNGFANDLNQTDNLTLDIVSILFDYILDDPAIPDAMKALIGRLQIPILKVALMDKELFSKKSHPARRLLDGLAEAALGWSETSPQQDDLYQVVEGIVKEIVGEFDSDMSLFSVLLERLDTFLQEDARTARQRAEESARSLHARERIVVAKMTVDDAVNARLGQSEVRTFIRQFVLDYWRQLLIVTHVEAGADSPEWQRQLGVVDDLVWSVQPKATPGDRKALTEKLPQLVKQLKLGMKALEMEPAICSKFLTMLASVHVVSVKQVEEATLAERRVTAQAAAPEPTLPPPAAASEEEFVKQALGRLFERKAIDTTELDIDLTAFASAESAEDDSPADAVDEFFDLVMTLDLGDWVEFTSSDGAVTRARFTWISPATGRYLFTTRQGHKALDLTMAGLAALFRAGDARKIDAQPDPIFDRAIGELMERLEQQSTAH